MTTNKLLSSISLVFLATNLCWAQPSEKNISKSEYIDAWKDEAIQQMIAYKIPASITLAQGILESGSGNSSLAKYGNNHFGIKCHEWEGEGIYKDDDAKNECFRKYNNASESFEDHSKFLAHRSRYQELFELNINDYKGWAKGLKKAGYATNPKYAELLIELIENNDLHKYDNYIITAQNKKPKETEYIIENSVLARPKVNSHLVQLHENKVRYIFVKEGDTFYKISKEFNVSLWQLYKYNNFDENSFIKPGDKLFLQPKRSKCSTKTHVVKKGETLHGISQEYGVKLNSLLKKNHLEENNVLQVGQKIKL